MSSFWTGVLLLNVGACLGYIVGLVDRKPN